MLCSSWIKWVDVVNNHIIVRSTVAINATGFLPLIHHKIASLLTQPFRASSPFPDLLGRLQEADLTEPSNHLALYYVMRIFRSAANSSPTTYGCPVLERRPEKRGALQTEMLVLRALKGRSPSRSNEMYSKFRTVLLGSTGVHVRL